MSSSDLVKNAVGHVETEFANTLKQLETLVKIPSVSFDGFPPETVEKSADAVAELMKESGIENVEVMKMPGVHPYVYGDWLHAPGKPTLLLYAHHDVQPPLREELWKTPPFEPVTQKGPNGDRMYGRGTADDKAGILVHTAAISAYLKTHGSLPVNVKLLIEGEEEIGSANLQKFLEQNREKFEADTLVLTDTLNIDSGVPSLTLALRGMVGLEMEVRALTKTVHSGMWGGPLPDPAMALTKALAGLVDENGRIAIKEVLDEVPPLRPGEEEELMKLPFNEEAFREQAGMIPSAQLMREGPSPMAQLWKYPCLTINGFQASSRKQPSNIINDVAWAKVSIRLAPGMRPDVVEKALRDSITNALPWGLEIKFSGEARAEGWETRPEDHKEIFEKAERALEKGYGTKPINFGCGGTIPFVQPITNALKAPALLVGVEDPYTNAHGENESLLISDFLKACVAQVYLFDELSR